LDLMVDDAACVQVDVSLEHKVNFFLDQVDMAELPTKRVLEYYKTANLKLARTLENYELRYYQSQIAQQVLSQRWLQVQEQNLTVNKRRELLCEAVQYKEMLLQYNQDLIVLFPTQIEQVELLLRQCEEKLYHYRKCMLIFEECKPCFSETAKNELQHRFKSTYEKTQFNIDELYRCSLYLKNVENSMNKTVESTYHLLGNTMDLADTLYEKATNTNQEE